MPPAILQMISPYLIPAIIRTPPEIVEQAVCRIFGMAHETLRAGTNKHEITLPRQVAMYMMRKHCKMSQQVIADYFGKKAPATVSHAERSIQNFISSPDKRLKEDIEKVNIIDKYLLSEFQN